MSVTTEDIEGWKRVVRNLLPPLAPGLTAISAYVLDPSSWRTAIAGGITGTIATLVAWGNQPPSNGQPKGSGPTPTPTPPLDRPRDTTIDLKKAAIFCLIFIGAIFAMLVLSDAAFAETRTSSAAPRVVVAPPVPAPAPKLGFGPSAIASFAGWRLSGDPRGAPLGVGVGAHLDFVLLDRPLRAGVYGASVLQLGDGSVFNLAVIAVLSSHEVLPVPVGIGFGWAAFSAGGAEPGVHDLHRQHLLIVGSFGIPIFGS